MKPDDVNQEAWNAAHELCISTSRFHPQDQYGLYIQDLVARAIMAAKAEEREACAKIADERTAICADAVAKVEAGELYQSFPQDAKITENCARMEASHIAKLIRSRT